MAVLGSGKLVAGVALMVASAALWPWRKRPGATGGVNVDEARALLGVPADADAETIRAAHRRLIAQTHPDRGGTEERSEEHTSELQSLMRISYAVFCLKKKINKRQTKF